MGETFAEVVRGGPLLLAIGASALAGLVSFLSPCVLPLVPGYLSYVTGLAGSDLDAARVRANRATSERATSDRATSDRATSDRADGAATTPVRTLVRPGRTLTGQGRVLAGTLLFIGGFTVVFTLTAIVLSSVGRALYTHRRPLEIVVGLLVVLLGLAFLGLVPGLQREFRLQRLPAAGLLGAPVFGAVFALSWVPCVGPTLGAVLGMATVSGQTDRAVVLAAAYCLGLGLPFVAFGLGFERLLGVFTAVRRNSRWVTRVGGALLIVIGLSLVSGGWQTFLAWLQGTVGSGEVSL